MDVALLLSAVCGIAPAQTAGRVELRTSSQIVDYWAARFEADIRGVAEAMPADKYPFAPANGATVSTIHVHPNGRFVYVANRESGTVDFEGKRVIVTAEPQITARLESRPRLRVAKN